MNNYKFYYCKPPKSLSRVVKGFWMISGKEGANGFNRVKILPCSGFGIISTLKGEFFYSGQEGILKNYPRSFLVGVRSMDYEVSIFGDYELFGIIFHPEIYHSLHLTSAKELVDNKIALSNIFEKNSSQFEEELYFGETFMEKTAVASRYLENHFLLRQKSPDEKFGFLMRDIHSHLYLKNVDEISKMCSMSIRNFNRTFLDRMGINPKKYNRIIRFQKIINYFNSERDCPNLTSLAYEFGYVDQSHFIRDFSKLSGTTPLRFKNSSAFEPKEELIKELTHKMKNADLIHA
ncbi:helix-turn-helix domain-containing protein [Pleomorphovibrio marinus]|uniref:helix-turn-helix domain-containing protein n=1 Tax=Pleomorphovibrio marinus TaxID=2164132 RepID=UPI000E0AA72F|nr:AraC family transcriptional regulator [Pleomorphovibrio marinus]